MQQALKLHAIAKWIAVTYLPLLWRPDAHMFLKPKVTTDFASRVGHRLANDYAPQLDAHEPSQFRFHDYCKRDC
jgi:hypothetical protein